MSLHFIKESDDIFWHLYRNNHRIGGFDLSELSELVSATQAALAEQNSRVMSECPQNMIARMGNPCRPECVPTPDDENKGCPAPRKCVCDLGRKDDYDICHLGFNPERGDGNCANPDPRDNGMYCGHDEACHAQNTENQGE